MRKMATEYRVRLFMNIEFEMELFVGAFIPSNLVCA